MADREEDDRISGRDQAAAEDRWLSAHARALLEATSEGILALDAWGRCVFANAPARRMLGYGPGEILGVGIHALVHHARPDGPPHTEEACPMRRAVRTGEGLRSTDEVFWARDGSALPVDYALGPIIEDGKVAGATMTFRDLTRRKQDLQRLRESNRRTEDVLESITDAFYSLDREWRFTYLNAEAERLLQRTREELLGKNLWEEFPETVGSATYEQFHRALAEQATVEFERYSPMLGAWFEIRAYPSEGGLSVYFLNVDGRKKAEAERERLLGAYERRAAELDAVVHSIPDAVYIGDEAGIQACNDAALEMLGFGDLAEMNQNISVLGERLQNRFAKTGERIPPEEEPFARALRGETVVEEVISRHLKAGRDVVVRCAAAPIRHEGEILGAVAVNTDITGRKRAEEELRKSQERTEDILESVTDAFYAMDEEWRFTYLNERALRFASELSGEEFTREGLLGRTLWETLPAIVGTSIEERYRRAVREQETTVFEYTYPGGGPVFEVHAYPSEQGLSVYFRDITDRKRVEEELSESEDFVRSTLNSLSAHIAILDETGLILATNRAWQGFAASNPPITARTGTGTNYLEVCDAASGAGADEAAAFARGIRDVIAGRRDSFEMEYPCHSPEERRWFVGRVTRFPEANPPKVVVAHENVTERKLVMEEIELRARQQEAVADLGRKALAGPDLSTLMDEAVEVVASILGVEFTKVVELLPGGDRLLLRAGVGWKDGLLGNVTEEAGEGSHAGYTLLMDEPVILEDLAEETRFERPPLLHEHGVVSGMCTIIRGYEGNFGVLGAHTRSRRVFTVNDVNFLRAVANVLGEAIEWRRAEERMSEIREAERSRMARDLHDGPLQDLTYALTAAQLVQSNSQDPSLDRWLEGTVEALKRTGRELRAAVHDLRLEELRDKPFPELVGYLVALNRRMAPDRRIRLHTEEGFPNSPLGKNDTELLRIVQEALTNTRRHSEAQNVVVSLGARGGEVWLEVSDDGRGFGPGTDPGVGLKSMSERAHALGGVLEVQSKPGKGTRVRFARAAGGGEAGEPAVEEQEIRVLLVEDHASFRDAAAAVFERERGFRVVGQAGSLAEAREMIGGSPLAVDLAIVDLGLPDGYGGDLIRDLRETNPQAQALVLSASLDRAETARAVEAGAAGVLHKSAGMDEVLHAVRRLLAGESLLSLEEVVELLRLAAASRYEDLDARQAIERLTPREREVLEALAEGLDGKEIARRLQISDKTERNHMASIMTKLGVHSRLQALVFALRHGAADIR